MGRRLARVGIIGAETDAHGIEFDFLFLQQAQAGPEPRRSPCRPRESHNGQEYPRFARRPLCRICRRPRAGRAVRAVRDVKHGVLSPAAELDLDDIWDYSADTGIRQAERYICMIQGTIIG